jgi:hypothetical protein
MLGVENTLVGFPPIIFHLKNTIDAGKIRELGKTKT